MKIALKRKVFYPNIIFLMTLFVFGLFYPALKVEAQSSAGVRISPSIIEDRIEPGESISGVIRATNLEPNSRTFYLIKKDISGIGPGGQPEFAEFGELTGYELSEWVTLGKDEITLDSQQEGEVPFTINVPIDASPGGHFGGVFLSAEAERQRTTGAGVGYQVGTIMNLRIGGDIVEEAQIREFLTDKLLYGSADVNFETTVENQGNVLIRPRGTIDITDMFGKKAGTLRINDSGAAVLPESKRKFQVSWNEEGLFFGRYEAIIALVYGEDGRKTISSATSFWVLPLRVILPILGGILLFILVVYFGMRMYVQRKLNEMYRHSRGRVRGKPSLRVARTRAKAPFPKVAVVVIALLVFTMVFMSILFLFFA
jgi:hypothetical protein